MDNVAPDSLAGRRGWIISDGVAGHLAITRGVAETLGLDRGEAGRAARAVAAARPARPGRSRQLAAAAGRASPRHRARRGAQDRAVRSCAEAGRGLHRDFPVAARKPSTAPISIWAPAHDGLTGANVITTLTPPHRFTAARSTSCAATPAGDRRASSPRVALLLGGPGAGYHMTPPPSTASPKRLRHIAEAGAASSSRPRAALRPRCSTPSTAATAGNPRILWRGEGDNPYPQFLARPTGSSSRPTLSIWPGKPAPPGVRCLSSSRRRAAKIPALFTGPATHGATPRAGVLARSRLPTGATSRSKPPRTSRLKLRRDGEPRGQELLTHGYEPCQWA